MRRRASQRRSSGFIVILVLFVIVVMMTAAMLVAASLQHRMWLLRQEHQTVHLTALLDGGLAKALSQVFANPDNLNPIREPLGDGSIEVTLTKESGLVVIVEVRAFYQNGVRSAVARVRIDRARRDRRRPPRVLSWSPAAIAVSAIE